MVMVCSLVARGPVGGFSPTDLPDAWSLSTLAVVYLKPGEDSAERQALTEEQSGPSRVLPFSTVGSAAGKSGVGPWFRIGSIASRQMVAGLLPPTPPTFWFCLGLSTMTLETMFGV